MQGRKERPGEPWYYSVNLWIWKPSSLLFFYTSFLSCIMCFVYLFILSVFFVLLWFVYLLFICIMYPQSGHCCKRALCSVNSPWINNDDDDDDDEATSIFVSRFPQGRQAGGRMCILLFTVLWRKKDVVEALEEIINTLVETGWPQWFILLRQVTTRSRPKEKRRRNKTSSPLKISQKQHLQITVWLKTAPPNHSVVKNSTSKSQCG